MKSAFSRVQLPAATGIILAGGSSRRMGRDKALVELDGRPMILHVLESLRRVCDEVLIAANAQETYAQFGVPVVPDQFPGSGSLGGIYSGLAASNHEYAFVVACDMPMLNVELIEYLLTCAPGFDVVIPSVPNALQSKYKPKGMVTAKEIGLHPLHAVYSRQCLGPISDKITQGDLRLISFHDQVRVRTVAVDEIDPIDPQHLSFFNANSPEELARAQGLFRSRPA